jgi:hypothetical protein
MLPSLLKLSETSRISKTIELSRFNSIYKNERSALGILCLPSFFNEPFLFPGPPQNFVLFPLIDDRNSLFLKYKFLKELCMYLTTFKGNLWGPLTTTLHRKSFALSLKRSKEFVFKFP